MAKFERINEQAGAPEDKASFMARQLSPLLLVLRV